jgi:hypothetical protein
VDNIREIKAAGADMFVALRLLSSCVMLFFLILGNFKTGKNWGVGFNLPV